MYEEEKTFVQVTKAEGLEPELAELFLKGGTDNGSIQLDPGQKIALELDAGELTTGYLTVGVRGGRGSIVRLLSSECYEPQESRLNQRIKRNRENASGKLMGAYDVYHVAGVAGEEGIEIYEPLSVRTLKRCMHETYEDCPYYEQLQYAMDSRLTMLFTYYISADDRLPRRTIADFYRSRLPGGLLQSRFPSVEPQVIPSFALYWVDMLAEHYAFNGDLELIKKYRPALIELLDWYVNQLTEQGIVSITSHRYWTYFDWVDEWPEGAPPESKDRPMFLLSLMYAKALRTGPVCWK